ncbi:asparagine synthase-domain-containing protein [Cokeromyces recurvatus]|uniref:asparagine synthase-domain-containing protein n=1 Tax=Cokeromyces recurvatus TaxID=90255 RepID=UPI00221EA711|nr:asparagine synthase-domain-containing protein [Cokeromyces recurvatus]KAI7898362.1 asparagine synthase-domain-containing protein [Cokeromyces recurvatus]
MCGILFSLSTEQTPVDVEEWENLKELNTRRGPDAQNLHQVHTSHRNQELLLQFFSSVLHLRGSETVPQPRYNSQTGNVLCWNGEIFGGIDVEFGHNDTQILMDQLEKTTTENDILDVLQKIEGPFAFVYYRAATHKIYFGRDCLGRRSLLWYHPKNGPFMLSSVGKSNTEVKTDSVWEEVPAIGFFSIDLQSDINDTTMKNSLPLACGIPIKLFPWKYDNELDSLETKRLSFPFSRINSAIPELSPIEKTNVEPAIDSQMQKTIEEFISILGDSVQKRVADIPYLNTKGQARVAILFSGGLDCICLAALANKYLPMSESIDLLNVAFENPRVENAAKIRNKKNKKDQQTKEDMPITRSIYDTPDRLTGKAGVEELQRIAPERVWNFVEINVPYAESLEFRQRIIDRMFPLDTVMDLSIAMAFWFASRGKGIININGKTNEYESHARVLLSGLGADEQLGGYSRHREAFRQGGWEKLIKETQLDVDRISTRNLGRDDRIMSDHGKEVRFPFLSTYVVNWLCQQPIQLKMDLRYERGIGEKLLLRHVARKLGLINASRNWKRAIQFGAKTAKMTGEARSEKGQHKLTAINQEEKIV